MTMNKPWFVRVYGCDGTHEIAKGDTWEIAKAKADEWLGNIATWTDKNRAVSMFGDVLVLTQLTRKEEDRFTEMECGE